MAQLVVDSSPRARDRAVRAVEFWGLSKGAISSLYAIMFSSKPIPSLQRAAYIVLSTEPISRLAIVADGNVSPSDESLSDQDSSNVGLPSEEKLQLRDEISCMVEKLNYELLDTDLTAPDRVRFTFKSFLFNFCPSSDKSFTVLTTSNGRCKHSWHGLCYSRMLTLYLH